MTDFDKESSNVMAYLKKKATKLKLKESGTAVTQQQSRRPDRLSRREAGLLSRAVILEETDPPQSLRTTIWVVSVFVFGFFIWASLAQFDEKAVAPGEILPQTLIQGVQHLEGGIVAEVYVTEGQFVKAGEALIKMDDTRPRNERDAVATLYASLMIQAERWDAYIDGRVPDFSIHETNYPNMATDAMKSYRSSVIEREGRLNTLNSQVASRRLELEGLKDQQKAIESTLASLAEEVAVKTKLVEAGTLPRLPFMSLQRELTEKQSDLAQVRTDFGRAGANLAEAQSRKQELEAEMRKSALDKLANLTTEASVKGQNLESLNDQLRRTVIRSPISGSIKGLNITKPGAVVPSGALIMEVVPNNVVLIAEVRVSPADIGHITQGLPAIIKVDTYKYGRLGGIKGTVSRISATTFEDEQGDAYFKTWIMLEQDYVGYDPSSNRVVPGMTLVADIRTGSKSLLAYLARPITYSLDVAFSER